MSEQELNEREREAREREAREREVRAREAREREAKEEEMGQGLSGGGGEIPLTERNLSQQARVMEDVVIGPEGEPSIQSEHVFPNQDRLLPGQGDSITHHSRHKPPRRQYQLRSAPKKTKHTRTREHDLHRCPHHHH